MPSLSLSLSAAVVLQAVANGFGYGFDIMDATGLPSGTVYPALRRMEEVGLIASSWEKANTAQRQQRPPRKYYELTRPGAQALAEAVTRYRLLSHPTTQPNKPARKRSERS